MAVTAKPTVAMPMLATEKLRSRKSSRGTSGSLLVRDCCQRNRAITSTPPMIIAHTHGAQS